MELCIDTVLVSFRCYLCEKSYTHTFIKVLVSFRCYKAGDKIKVRFIGFSFFSLLLKETVHRTFYDSKF